MLVPGSFATIQGRRLASPTLVLRIEASHPLLVYRIILPGTFRIGAGSRAREGGRCRNTAVPGDVLPHDGTRWHSLGKDLRDPGRDRLDPARHRGPAHREPRRRSIPDGVPRRAG